MKSNIIFIICILFFCDSYAQKVTGNLKDNKLLRVQSVLSYLIASNDPDKKELTLHQFELFKNICSQIEEGIGYTFIRHIANTSAIDSIKVNQWLPCNPP